MAEEENLRTVLAALAAYLRGDEAAMLAAASPDIVVTQFPDQLDVRDFHGHDGVRESIAAWTGTWEDWAIEPLSSSASGELVFLNALQRGRGRGSGAPIEAPVTFLFTVRDGAIVRWQMFHTEQEARGAAGLDP